MFQVVTAKKHRIRRFKTLKLIRSTQANVKPCECHITVMVESKDGTALCNVIGNITVIISSRHLLWILLVVKSLLH